MLNQGIGVPPRLQCLDAHFDFPPSIVVLTARSRDSDRGPVHIVGCLSICSGIPSNSPRPDRQFDRACTVRPTPRDRCHNYQSHFRRNCQKLFRRSHPAQSRAIRGSIVDVAAVSDRRCVEQSRHRESRVMERWHRQKRRRRPALQHRTEKLADSADAETESHARRISCTRTHSKIRF